MKSAERPPPGVTGRRRWIGPLATPFLAPILYRQGRRVRREALRLPEASGARAGTSGTGRRLRLLVLGDSSAAGVGVPEQSEALTGRLIERLSESATIDWKLIARTGATTASTIRRVRGEPRARFDHVVVCLGVNDVTSGIGVRRWIESQRELRAVLRDRFGARHLIVNGLPPVRAFPLLPQPLRWYLGDRALRFSSRLEQDLREEPDCRYQDLEFTSDVTLMAEDGFHPGPTVYREWAERVARLVRDDERLRAPGSRRTAIARRRAATGA